MRKYRYLIILLFIISICLADEYATTNSGKIVLLKDNNTWEYIERLQAKILKIVDGDTIKIEYDGTKENVRLIGIDTPESRANSKAKKDAERSGKNLETIIAMGKAATNYVKSIIEPGINIEIELDIQSRDKYGRLLGYVYLTNGEMLNEKIVNAGYASVMTIPPNIKYQDSFLKAYKEARENSRGLWKDRAFDTLN